MASPTQIQQYLAGVDYPASRDELISHAEDMNATTEVIEALQGIEDRQYQSPSDLMKEVGAAAM